MLLKREVMAIRNEFMESVGLYVFERDEHGKKFIADPLKMVPCKMGAHVVPSPLVDMNIREAQKLMDQLWECGLRPARAMGSMGQLEAVKYHLEDMRKLALGKGD